MKAASVAAFMTAPLLEVSRAQERSNTAPTDRTNSLRILENQNSYQCSANNTDDLSEWEEVLDTCNLESQHLSFMACTKINTGERHDQYQSSAHSYAYYVKQYFTFKTCYHGQSWKKLYFWEQGADEVCKLNAEHTLSVEDYFYATSECVDNYCSACYNQCGGNGRGLGEENGGEQGYDWSSNGMNCYYCTKNCRSYATLHGNYGGNNDGKYYSPHCTKVFDQSGTDYYYGPVCTEQGGVGMGFFFDNKCELNVKKEITIDESSSSVSSSFDVFQFVHEICHDCATDVCESVYNSAYHCSARNGTYITEGADILQEYEGYEEDMEAAEELCLKTHKAKQIIYNHNHSTRASAVKREWEAVGFVALGLVLVGVVAFGFISYTYYVRHCVDWGDSSLMCWSEGCGGCNGGDVDDDDDVISVKKKKGRRLV
ncbi:hypothetical protein HJC23_000855 [Cyclotella cryptica]|uniref:Uncharacterized protein n=1 Tax=Cyclotella cryptica TaxID=29204 RepID=A0ABD3PTR8_9STRA|eukprot:CCRYP_011567-RA/>CCRYP_011567-RA protein AED:0.22 eAED:0.22 QI:0/-1/0/1/-1/1/1/0/427